ncbi:Fusaric acid biosynthesis protein 2 [Lachnellula arida]|uniref:Fusaric acid biosynthesis protein 2 n=1 Tax=Lachnellula arida TaxID=1316785 RepID=A0A8T9B665_9HELO|nr:Fusaric acid biosynthesis protein 2 [Lachnellula arida]
MSTSTTTPAKHEWLVILPDREGMLQKRLEARPEHLTGVKPQAEAGALLFGGAFFDDPPAHGGIPQIKGTVLLAYAESKEKVLEGLRQDAYTKTGVWDWDKVQIYAFKTALRRELVGGI